jgi:hypothetical protein
MIKDHKPVEDRPNNHLFPSISQRLSIIKQDVLKFFENMVIIFLQGITIQKKFSGFSRDFKML